MIFLLLSCHPVVPPGAPGSTPGNVDRVYELVPGDNLTWVAQDYGVAGGYMALARHNGIPHPNWVLAGDKLRVPTADERLPTWPKLTRAVPTTACAATPVAATGVSLSGCTTAACVDLGLGATACACAQPGGGKLLVQRPGQAPWVSAVYTDPPWWLDPYNVPEPSGTAALLAWRTQLDADPQPESVVAWRHALSDLGQSDWTVLTTDHDGAPTATFSAGNFGSDAIVKGTEACELFATDWVMADEPRRDNDGWYLVGRRYTVGRDGLRPATGANIVARRLWDSYEPGLGRATNIVTGTPGADLGHPSAFTRSTEPELERRTDGATTWRASGALRSNLGTLVLSHDGQAVEVGASSSPLRRLGDRATGLLYPRGYVPGNPGVLMGKPVVEQAYLPSWDAAFSVAWLD